MTPFIIRSNIKQKLVVSIYVMNLAKALNIHRFRKRAFEISFRRKMEEGVMGLCWGDTDWVDIDISRTGTWREQMVALAHEMVHCKQFLRGELDGFRWKKRNYENCQYDHQPWEKQAYALEEKLYEECYPHALCKIKEK